MPGIISLKKAGKLAGVSLVAIGLGACSQMQKHSNMLVFGTNTTVGVNLGKDASQTPTVQIGFNRQELALVPMLANVKAAQADNNSTGQDLEPCDISGANGRSSEETHNCLFVATSETTVTETPKGGTSVTKTVTNRGDAYSTLASFGARISGTNEGGNKGNGAVAVAQYFATGIAAQKLAEEGGANVILADGNSGKKADANKEKAIADQKQAEVQKLEYLSQQKRETLEKDAAAIPELKLLIETNSKDDILDQDELDILNKALPDGGKRAGLNIGKSIKYVIGVLESDYYGELPTIVRNLKKQQEKNDGNSR